MTKPKAKIVSVTTTSTVVKPVTTNKTSKLVAPDTSRPAKPKPAPSKPAAKKIIIVKKKAVAKSTPPPLTTTMASLFMKPLVKQEDVVSVTPTRELPKVEKKPETISFQELMNKPNHYY